MIGALEGVSSTFGEILNTIAGLRITRTTKLHDIGETSLFVETTFDWPDQGKIFLNGVYYSYSSKSGITLDGLEWNNEGPIENGLRDQITELTRVFDFSGTFSEFDRLRGSIMLRTASGEDLNIIANNLGIRRPPTIDEESFRKIIKALAYSPKGTLFILDTVLNSLLGEDNYRIIESLEDHPNKVIIEATNIDGYLSQREGKAYLENDTVVSFDTNTLQAEVPSYTIGVYDIRFNNEDHVLDTGKHLPSSFTIERYPSAGLDPILTYSGTESAHVTLESANNRSVLDYAAGQSGYYEYPTPLLPTSDWSVSLCLSVPQASNALRNADPDKPQWEIIVEDTDKIIRAGIECIGTSEISFNFRLLNGDDAFTPQLSSANTVINLGEGLFSFPYKDDSLVPVGLPSNWVRPIEFEVKKKENNVTLSINGKAHASVPYEAFVETGANNKITIGKTQVNNGFEADLSSIKIGIQHKESLWSLRGEGEVDTSFPNRFVADTNVFIPSDVGEGLTIKNSSLVNSFGGNNNGNWFIQTYTSPTTVSLSGETKDRGSVSRGYQSRFLSLGFNDEFSYPDDLGKTLDIIGQQSYTIAFIVDPITGSPYRDYTDTLRLRSNAALIVGAFSGIDESVGGDLTIISPNTVQCSNASTFLGSNVGDFLFLKDYDQEVLSSNIGIFTITEVVNSTTVRLNSVSIGRPLSPQTLTEWRVHEGTNFLSAFNLSWRLLPNFQSEIGVKYILGNGGNLSGTTASLRRLTLDTDWTGITPSVKVLFSGVLSSQALSGVNTENQLIDSLTNPRLFSHYPFYMPHDPLGDLRSFIDQITVAGVLSEIKES